MYKDVLNEDFIEQYKSYHMTLFRELNIMLFDVAFLKERFEITNYPAYFLLDKEGKVRYSWEGMIEEDQAFRDSLRKGLEGI